jgi:glycosyltransferase involved in cell wall biosynthesis
MRYMNLSTVSIGLPTYNRAALLKGVLDNLRHQTFGDFELIISDNASTDPGVRELCEQAVAEDRRVRYVRQKVNRGGAANFRFVYEAAASPFFMWASDDDIWPQDFIARGISALKRNPTCSAWFCQVANINSDGEIIRRYPSFTRFRSTRSKFLDLVRFIWEPEIMGKANLIYALYRRESLADLVGVLESPVWGVDMAFVYGYLCRNNIIIDDDVVLKKRVFTLEKGLAVGDPRAAGIYPWLEAPRYLRAYVSAARGTHYVGLTAATLTARLFYDVLYRCLKLRQHAPIVASPN